MPLVTPVNYDVYAHQGKILELRYFDEPTKVQKILPIQSVAIIFSPTKIRVYGENIDISLPRTAYVGKVQVGVENTMEELMYALYLLI